MASFNFDQAEGLRRMLAGPKPRVLTVLSATSQGEKNAMLMNLGASLAYQGSDVLLLDATLAASGVGAAGCEAVDATLMDVARQERALSEAVRKTAHGFGITRLTRGPVRVPERDSVQGRRLANAFGALAKQGDIIVVDGELDADAEFPLEALSAGEILVQVSTAATSIKDGYALIKRLNASHGKRSFSLVVTGASEKEAQVIYQNMAQAASRYLAVPLESAGWVPADEHLKRAARLGRTVIDAFPMAGASAAFRQLAGRFAASVQTNGVAHARMRNGANYSA